MTAPLLPQYTLKHLGVLVSATSLPRLCSVVVTLSCHINYRQLAENIACCAHQVIECPPGSQYAAADSSAFYTLAAFVTSALIDCCTPDK